MRLRSVRINALFLFYVLVVGFSGWMSSCGRIVILQIPCLTIANVCFSVFADHNRISFIIEWQTVLQSTMHSCVLAGKDVDTIQSFRETLWIKLSLIVLTNLVFLKQGDTENPFKSLKFAWTVKFLLWCNLSTSQFMCFREVQLASFACTVFVSGIDDCLKLSVSVER